jgi:FMN-dependent NADH-azoreductase
MALLRLDASIRIEESQSRAIADLVEAEWSASRPEEPIVRRQIGADPVPAWAWRAAVFARDTPPGSRTADQKAAVALAAELVDEMLDADAMIFAVPLYNFGVSQHFKSWVDLIIADPRMAANAEPLLAGMPAVLVTVRGGAYGAGTPREGCDHATGWMRRILADVWRLDLEVVEAEFTLVGVNPALDQFKELASTLRRDADERSRLAGKKLGASTARPK